MADNWQQMLASFRQQPNQDPYVQRAGGYLAPAGGQSMYPQRTMADHVYGATVGNMLGGLGTMNNLGNQIGNAFDVANMMSSLNRQAQYAPAYQHQSVVDTNRSNERMQQQAVGSRENILSGLLPQIIAALNNFGGGGPGGFQTSYGAGGQIGSQAQPTNVQAMRKNPILDQLARMGVGA